MDAETLRRLRKRIKEAEADGLSQTFIERLHELYRQEEQLYRQSRLPGFSRTVAEEAETEGDDE